MNKDCSPDELYEPACRVLWMILSADTPYANRMWKKKEAQIKRMRNATNEALKKKYHANKPGPST